MRHSFVSKLLIWTPKISRRRPACNSNVRSSLSVAIVFILVGHLRLRSDLVPKHSARERFLMSANVNTPFYQVPTPEFGHGARARAPCTRALNWAN